MFEKIYNNYHIKVDNNRKNDKVNTYLTKLCIISHTNKVPIWGGNMRLRHLYLLTIYLSIVAFFILLSNGFAATQNALFFNNFNDYMADLFNPIIVAASNDPYDVITNTEQEYFYYGYLITNADRIYPPLAYIFFRLMVPLFSYIHGSDIMFAHYIMLLGAVFYILLLYKYW